MKKVICDLIRIFANALRTSQIFALAYFINEMFPTYIGNKITFKALDSHVSALAKRVI